MANSRWANLPPDLISCIAGRYLRTLRYYVVCRQICSSWRSALEPPSLALFLFSKDGEMPCTPAFSHPLRLRPTPHLSKLLDRGRCIGSSGGWLALDVAPQDEQSPQPPFCPTDILLVNPLSGEEIALPPLDLGRRTVSKVVFAPNLSEHDFTVVAIDGIDALAYLFAGDAAWLIYKFPFFGADDLADVLLDDGSGKIYCLTSRGDVHVMHIPRGAGQESVAQSLLPGRRRLGPHDVFHPVFAVISDFATTKRLALCEGDLYQVWRNNSCTVTAKLREGGGRFRVRVNDTFVLRYDPGRRPCWGAVSNLGGRSLLVGTNNALPVRPGGAPWARANCVYWASEHGTEPAMVFDMETRTPTPCFVPPEGAQQQRTVSWWYVSGDMGSGSGKNRKEFFGGGNDDDNKRKNVEVSKMPT